MHGLMSRYLKSTVWQGSCCGRNRYSSRILEKLQKQQNKAQMASNARKNIQSVGELRIQGLYGKLWDSKKLSSVKDPYSTCHEMKDLAMHAGFDNMRSLLIRLTVIKVACTLGVRKQPLVNVQEWWMPCLHF